MKPVTKEVQIYVDEFKEHARKSVEHYIEAGKVIIRAKKYLAKNGEVQAFYDGCGISNQKASELCSIAKSEVLNEFSRRGGKIEILEGGQIKRIIKLPETIDLAYRELRNIPVVEKRVIAGTIAVVHLQQLIDGEITYANIKKEHKQLDIRSEAVKNSVDEFGLIGEGLPVDATKPYINEEGEIVKPQTKDERDKDCKIVADIFDRLNKLKTKDEKVSALLHGKEVKVGRHSYKLVLVE